MIFLGCKRCVNNSAGWQSVSLLKLDWSKNGPPLLLEIPFLLHVELMIEDLRRVIVENFSLSQVYWALVNRALEAGIV